MDPRARRERRPAASTAETTRDADVRVTNTRRYAAHQADRGRPPASAAERNQDASRHSARQTLSLLTHAGIQDRVEQSAQGPETAFNSTRRVDAPVDDQVGLDRRNAEIVDRRHRYDKAARSPYPRAHRLDRRIIDDEYVGIQALQVIVVADRGKPPSASGGAPAGRSRAANHDDRLDTKRPRQRAAANEVSEPDGWSCRRCEDDSEAGCRGHPHRDRNNVPSTQTTRSTCSSVIADDSGSESVRSDTISATGNMPGRN